MKKLIALLLVLVMALSLAACGGDETAKSKKEDETTQAAKGLEEKYDVDLEAAGEQKLSDERAAEDVLVETRDEWLGGQFTFALDPEPKTYEDLAEHIGCDASYYTYVEEDGERHFVWVAEGDETAKFLAVFWETPNGWVLYSVGSTNIG